MSAPTTTRPPPPASPSHARRGAARPITRRAFLRNSWLAGLAPLLATFTGASIAFLWPNLRGGFGSEIDVDTESEVRGSIEANKAPYVYPTGRMYVVAYDPALDADGKYAEITGGSSLMALYHKCPHLGCRVPWCQTSQWFECPCHGSRYNRWGEYQAGPAPPWDGPLPSAHRGRAGAGQHRDGRDRPRPRLWHARPAQGRSLLYLTA